MNQLCFQDKCRLAAAWILVKMGKLTHDAFTEDELNALLSPHLPIKMDVEVPAGNASLVCQSGRILLPLNENEIRLHLLNDFRVVVMGNPIYRAHISATITAVPEYVPEDATLYIRSIKLTSLDLVHDEYSLVKDTTTLLQNITPLSIAGTLVSPLKSVVNTFTGGLSNSAIRYLESFTHGNKQRLLEQHKPSIEEALQEQISQIDTHVTMRETVWREYLFSRLGKRVTVDDQLLKFWFS